MRKYHVADLLSGSRILSGIVFIVLGVLRKSPSDMIIAFLTISLYTDAIDGPLAKRWPYPNDGKKRWWRKSIVGPDGVASTTTQLDTAADLFFGATLIFYIHRTISIFWARVLATAVPLGLLGLLVIHWAKRYFGNEVPKLEFIRLLLYLAYISCTVTVIIALGPSHTVFWVSLHVIAALVVLILKRGRLVHGKAYLGK